MHPPGDETPSSEAVLPVGGSAATCLQPELPAPPVRRRSKRVLPDGLPPLRAASGAGSVARVPPPAAGKSPNWRPKTAVSRWISKLTIPGADQLEASKQASARLFKRRGCSSFRPHRQPSALSGSRTSFSAAWRSSAARARSGMRMREYCSARLRQAACVAQGWLSRYGGGPSGR